MTKFNKTYLIAISGITLSWVCAFYLGYNAQPEPKLGAGNPHTTYNYCLGLENNQENQVAVQVKFKKVDIVRQNYTDALYYECEQELAPEEFEAKVENDKNERFNNWKKVIEDASKATSTPEVINE